MVYKARPDSHRSFVLALIPVHNEELTLTVLLRSILSLQLPLEICIVDSACSDSTILLAKHYPLHILHAPQKGYAQALYCGYQYALKCGFQGVIQIDSDLQHPPVYIPYLYHALSNADWVIGSRQNTGTYGSFFRRMGAFLNRSVIAQTNLKDLSSGFWAFNQKTLSFFVNHFPVVHTEAPLRLQALAYGLRIKECPLPMAERTDGISMHQGFSSLRHGLSTIYQSYQLKKKHLF